MISWTVDLSVAPVQRWMRLISVFMTALRMIDTCQTACRKTCTRKSMVATLGTAVPDDTVIKIAGNNKVFFIKLAAELLKRRNDRVSRFIAFIAIPE